MYIYKKSNINFSAKPIPCDKAEKIKSELCKADSVDIFLHMSSDEDAINSARTMSEWLKSMKKNKKVRIIVDGDAKNFFNGNKNENIINAKDARKPDVIKKLKKKADLALVLDFNTTDKIPDNVVPFLNQYKKNEILGLDHHKKIEDTFIGNTNKNSLFYVDSTAKSCSAIIYRLFEALKLKPKEDELANLYCGMLDDLRKSDCVEINKGILKRTDEIQEFPDTVEVLYKIEEKLPEKLKNKIIKHLDIISKLTDNERTYYEGLFKKVKFIKADKQEDKIAYIEIPPDDQGWVNLSNDNVKNAVVNTVKQRLLQNNAKDEDIPDDIKEQLKDVKAVIIFHQDGEKYKMSLTSRNDYAQKVIDQASPEKASLEGKLGNGTKLQIAGQTKRVGIWANITDSKRCGSFIEYITEFLSKH